jgi:hypothetical protein
MGKHRRWVVRGQWVLVNGTWRRSRVAQADAPARPPQDGQQARPGAADSADEGRHTPIILNRMLRYREPRF